MDTAVRNRPPQSNVSSGAIRIEDVVKIYDPDGAAVMAGARAAVEVLRGMMPGSGPKLSGADDEDALFIG